MRLINVLTENSCPNSRAFNCPLLVAEPHFHDHGVTLRFHRRVTDRLFDGDVLFVNSKFFRYHWRDRKGEIFAVLERAKTHGMTVCWFDATDSTWCTQFEVTPYVDLFLKSQLLKDAERSASPPRTGRVYTDVFDELYETNEPEESYPPIAKSDLDKLRISWNTCFENYTENRFSFTSRLKQRLRPWAGSWEPKRFSLDFTPPNSDRPEALSCRVGLSHDRPSIVAHRREVLRLATKLGAKSGKLPLPAYFQELRRSRIGVGPFGVGEITLRDYEIILCGAALVKPDLSHMDTWPELFIADETYVPFRWDLSNFKEKIQELENEPEQRLAIAERAQSAYKSALSNEGMAHFAKRLLDMVEVA